MKAKMPCQILNDDVIIWAFYILGSLMISNLIAYLVIENIKYLFTSGLITCWFILALTIWGFKALRIILEKRNDKV